MENDKILKAAADIKKKFASESVDEVKVKESFVEKLHALLQSIFGDETDAAYELLEKGDLSNYRKSYLKRVTRFLSSNVKNIFYIAFMTAIVSFLVNEAAIFYAVDGVVTTNAYIQAILTELAFIFLSGYVPMEKAMKWVSRVLLGSVFCLMMFVISAETIKKGTSGSEESRIIAEQVITLEQQIKEKEKLIDYYISINWPKNASSTRLEKEVLVNKLINLKEEQSKGKNKEVSEVEVYKSYGKAAFRVILLLINLLISRRIFKF